MAKNDCLDDKFDDVAILLEDLPFSTVDEHVETKEEKLLKSSNEELLKKLDICKECTYENMLHCIKRLRVKMDVLNGRKVRFCDRPKLKTCSGYAKTDLLAKGKCKYFKSCAEAEIELAAFGVN